MRILFAQKTPCIRSWKIAQALKKLGHEMWLAHQNVDCVPYEKYGVDWRAAFVHAIPMKATEDVCELSRIADIVHCHNQPDHLTIAALGGSAPVVHDCHDLTSLNQSRNPNPVEAVAIQAAHAVVYVSEIQKQEAHALYRHRGPSVIVRNLPTLASTEATRQASKWPAGERHSVYAGSLSDHPDSIYSIADKLIGFVNGNPRQHVHLYPAWPRAALFEVLDLAHPRIHLHDAIPSEAVISEIAQYHSGLLVYNRTPVNQAAVDTLLPHKLFEYRAAGIPVELLSEATQIERVGLDVEVSTIEEEVESVLMPLYKDLLT